MSEVNSIVTYREVPGFPGYRVGDDGSVWTSKFPGGRKGFAGWRKRGLPLRSGGYPVATFKDNGKCKQWAVHRLVLEVFVGQCPDGMEACHNDGNPSNNNLNNLRWDTHKNNIKDKIPHGTMCGGEAHPRCIISDEIVGKIKEEYVPRRVTAPFLANKYGISACHVRDIISGRRRKRSTPEKYKDKIKE